MKKLVALLLPATLVALLIIPSVAQAADVVKSGTVTVTGRVDGPPPSTPATIDEPSDGQNFTQNVITVAGTCPSDDIVLKITDNGTLVGSTACHGGVYSLDITLYVGSNRLITQEIDSLDQSGPDSAPVTVTYTPPTPPNSVVANPASPSSGHTSNPIAATGAPVLNISLDPSFNANAHYKPGQEVTIPVKLSGGVAPFSLKATWQDGSQDDLHPTNDGQITLLKHTYKTPGTYEVKVVITDASGQTAVFNVVVIIDGQPPNNSGNHTIKLAPNIEYHVSKWVLGAIALIPLGYFGFKLGIEWLVARGKWPGSKE